MDAEWRMVDAKVLFEPMREYCWLGPYEEIPANFQPKEKYFHYRKGIWNIVYKMSAIFSRPHCVNIVVVAVAYIFFLTKWLTSDLLLADMLYIKYKAIPIIQQSKRCYEHLDIYLGVRVYAIRRTLMFQTVNDH